MSLSDEVLAQALALGFDTAGIVPVGPPRTAQPSPIGWQPAMTARWPTWPPTRPRGWTRPSGCRTRQLDPAGSELQPRRAAARMARSGTGRIPRYAWTADYHDVLKSRLYALDAFIRERTGRTTLGKACVDTSPLLERDFAEQAGLGFIGRNTCLITPGLGSWTFLAALAVPEKLDEGPKTKDESLSVIGPSSFVGTCGRCTRCLDACPARTRSSPRRLLPAAHTSSTRGGASPI